MSETLSQRVTRLEKIAKLEYNKVKLLKSQVKQLRAEMSEYLRQGLVNGK